MPEPTEQELRDSVRVLRAENARLKDYMRTAVQELAAVDDDNVFAPLVREYVHDTVVALSHALRVARPVPTSGAIGGDDA